MPVILLVLIAAALIFDFLCGFIGSSSIVATVVSSRALSARQALALTAAAEFAGPFLFGTAVAATVGRGLVDVGSVNTAFILAALTSAISWSLITWYFGWPSSTSHALVGGLVGAALAAGGPKAIHLAGLEKVILALFLSPLLGLLFGYLMLKLLYFLSRGASPSINTLFRRSQLVTAVALGFSLGTNDAQNAMGVMTLSLLVTGYLTRFVVPWWVVALCAAGMVLGTLVGGWRLIRTVGGKFYRIRPIHAFGSQLTSAAVILGSALLGRPVSATQVITSAVVGAGAADRVSKVRWPVVQDIVVAWLMTIPLTALLAMALYAVLRLVV